MRDDRRATVERTTAETTVRVELALDGRGDATIATPIPFFSHMLEALCRHGNLDVRLEATGDVEVDQHHTVEDVGLVLGTALRRALGERRGIRRMGSAFVPMDEALAFCAVDLSGRPFTVIRAAFAKTHQGGFELDLVPEFFRALATESRSTWHLAIQAGANEHHKAEALFKAAGRALGDAAARDPARGATVPSTKGVLE